MALPSSSFASFFGITWNRQHIKGKLRLLEALVSKSEKGQYKLWSHEPIEGCHGTFNLGICLCFSSSSSPSTNITFPLIGFLFCKEDMVWPSDAIYSLYTVSYETQQKLSDDALCEWRYCYCTESLPLLPHPPSQDSLFLFCKHDCLYTHTYSQMLLFLEILMDLLCLESHERVSLSYFFSHIDCPDEDAHSYTEEG